MSGLELEHSIVLGLFVPGTRKHTRRIARYDTSAVCICGQLTCTVISMIDRKWVTLKNCTAVYSVPYGNEGCMVDTLASRSDEGRDMAAISFGEVPNNL